MTPSEVPPAYQVKLVSASSRAGTDALHLAMGRPLPRSDELAPEVGDLLGGEAEGIAPRRLVISAAYAGNRMIWACVAVESEGRAALVLMPDCVPRLDTVNSGQLVGACLGKLMDECWRRGSAVLEYLCPAKSRMAAELVASGWHRLTTLRYMSRLTEKAGEVSRGRIEVEWVSYSPQAEDLFCEALDASYEQSLDCWELARLRETGDVLAGHRATGVFFPGRWWVAVQGGKPAGVILVNGIRGRSACELVYLGVAARFRRSGLGSLLLERALGEARAAGDALMTLAADVRNGPALSFYAGWGFEPFLEREAWIASPAWTGVS